MIDGKTAVHPAKTLLAQLVNQLAQRTAQRINAAAALQIDVVAAGLQLFDAGHRQQKFFIEFFHQQMLQGFGG